MSFAYEATFSMERWHGVPNNWVECDGIRLESNVALSIVRNMCEALTNAGKPDGPIVFYEDGYINPSYEFPSIFEIVERMHTKPSKSDTANAPVISDAIYQALHQLLTDPRNWNSLHGKVRSVLLDRGFVNVDKSIPEITALGHAAIDAHPEPVKRTVRTEMIYPADLTKAGPADLTQAAAMIGLKSEQNLARTLTFIETNAMKYSLQELEEMAWKGDVKPRTGRCKTEMMKKRRVLAAIINAGKLALVL